MAIPTKKDAHIDDLFKAAGLDRVACIEADICVMCKKDAKQFDDAVSRKEFTISGMCQICQDGVFGLSDED